MKIDLSGKTAFVGGASKGIGKATAQALALCGANVILCARDADTLGQVCAGLHNEVHQKHSFVQADFSDLKDLNQKVIMCAHTYEIDIVVNNTGGPAAGMIENAAIEEFEKAFTMHIMASQVIAQAFLPIMKKKQYGRIINIISTSVKQPLNGLGVSNTIRGAMGNWAKTLANEVAPYGVTVNNILPGATATDRLAEIISNKASKTSLEEEAIAQKMVNEIPMGRFANPEEIAQAAAFLASPLASYITGINLPVDGGRTKSL